MEPPPQPPAKRAKTAAAAGPAAGNTKPAAPTLSFWQQDWLSQHACYLAKFARWDELYALLDCHAGAGLVNRRPPTSSYSVLHHSLYRKDAGQVRRLITEYGASVAAVITAGGRGSSKLGRNCADLAYANGLVDLAYEMVAHEIGCEPAGARELVAQAAGLAGADDWTGLCGLLGGNGGKNRVIVNFPFGCGENPGDVTATFLRRAVEHGDAAAVKRLVEEFSAWLGWNKDSHAGEMMASPQSAAAVDPRCCSQGFPGKLIASARRNGHEDIVGYLEQLVPAGKGQALSPGEYIEMLRQVSKDGDAHFTRPHRTIACAGLFGCVMAGTCPADFRWLSGQFGDAQRLVYGWSGHGLTRVIDRTALEVLLLTDLTLMEIFHLLEKGACFQLAVLPTARLSTTKLTGQRQTVVRSEPGPSGRAGFWTDVVLGADGQPAVPEIKVPDKAEYEILLKYYATPEAAAIARPLLPAVNSRSFVEHERAYDTRHGAAGGMRAAAADRQHHAYMSTEKLLQLGKARTVQVRQRHGFPPVLPLQFVSYRQCL